MRAHTHTYLDYADWRGVYGTPDPTDGDGGQPANRDKPSPDGAPPSTAAQVDTP